MAAGGEPPAKRARDGAGGSADDDEAFMRAAIAEGRKGRVTAPPNPWVGCVLARGGEIIARGFHARAGEGHAEVQALRALPPGVTAEGATAYVTLEPCSHTGRTGPCCVALAEAGVARVVVACPDPDPRVSGNGVRYLRGKGVEVAQGVCEAEAAESLRPYLHQRRTGRPYVVIKMAATLDGCIACPDGTSQWITGPEARSRGHVIRAESQAIIVGSGTALKDDPRLTVRPPAPMPVSQPLRVVLDRRGRVTSGNLLDRSQAPTLIATAPGAPEAARRAWRDAGVDVDETAAADPDAVLRLLAEGAAVRHALIAGRGVLQVMVEGGGELHSDLLRRGLCDSLVVFYGPTVFGDGKRWLQRPLCGTISDATFLRLESVERVGDSDDVCMRYSRR